MSSQRGNLTKEIKRTSSHLRNEVIFTDSSPHALLAIHHRVKEFVTTSSAVNAIKFKIVHLSRDLGTQFLAHQV